MNRIVVVFAIQVFSALLLLGCHLIYLMKVDCFSPDILTAFWFVQFCNIGHFLHSLSDSQFFLLAVLSTWRCKLAEVTSHTCFPLSFTFLFGRYFSLAWVWTVLFAQVIKLGNFSSSSIAFFRKNFCLVWVWTVLFAQVTTLGHSSSSSSAFFGKNYTSVARVGAVIFAGKRTKPLSFFFLIFLQSFSFLQEPCSWSLELQLLLLIALHLNRLALVADIRFRFPREVSFLYWTYMMKNKNSGLRHGFTHWVWTHSFLLTDGCLTNHVTGIS